MQIGIRLHDVNTGLAPERQTLEARAETARAEGFSCVQLAFGKVIKGTAFDSCALTEGLAPVVERAEHWGVAVAIEPVWKHIVYDADRAVQVLRAIASPNLRIILDPVNLLHAGNAAERERVIGEAIDKLGEHVAAVHLKDFTQEGAELRACAAGTGVMDYSAILRFMKERKPYIQATLENTTNENAAAARMFLERAYESI